MDTNHLTPDEHAVQSRAVPEEETYADYTTGGDSEKLAREIYDEAISRLMLSNFPISLEMRVKDIMGTPPYLKNNLWATAQTATTDNVIISIHSYECTEIGEFYLATIYDGNSSVISEGDVRIRPWHMVHYLQKAVEIIHD